MHLENTHLRQIKKILTEIIPNQEVLAFGSRVHGKHLKKFSDLDLVIRSNTPVDLKILMDLKHAFSESDLPFKVDIIDWHRIDSDFKKIILNHFEIITNTPE